MANRLIKGRGNEQSDTDKLLEKLADLIVSKQQGFQQPASTGNQQQLFETLMDRLSKISGALRYKDAGMTIQINGSFNSAGRYSVNLASDIQFFPQASYEISMQSFAVEQSIPNVTSSNNKFYFSKTGFNGGAIQTITFPSGTYSTDTINSTVQETMQSLGLYNTSAAASTASANYYVSIGWVPATLKSYVAIQYGSGITIYFNQPNSMYKILGFLATDVFTDPNPTQTMSSSTISWYRNFNSTNVTNLTLDIISLNFGCTLAKGSVLIQTNGVLLQSSQIIASKPYIDPPGAILSIPAFNYPYTPLWLRMDDSCKKLRQFDVFCLDNNNNPVTFTGNNFNMVIAIRQV